MGAPPSRLHLTLFLSGKVPSLRITLRIVDARSDLRPFKGFIRTTAVRILGSVMIMLEPGVGNGGWHNWMPFMVSSHAQCCSDHSVGHRAAPVWRITCFSGLLLLLPIGSAQREAPGAYCYGFPEKTSIYFRGNRAEAVGMPCEGSWGGAVGTLSCKGSSGCVCNTLEFAGDALGGPPFREGRWESSPQIQLCKQA